MYCSVPGKRRQVQRRAERRRGARQSQTSNGTESYKWDVEACFTPHALCACAFQKRFGEFSACTGKQYILRRVKQAKREKALQTTIDLH